MHHHFSGPHYTVTNSKTLTGKMPVLFVHGNTSTSAWWQPLMQCFDSERYFCIAPDLNGFGRTHFRAIDARTGVRDWARDVVDLLDRLGISKVHVVCSSLGGVVGWELLARHGNRLLGLVQIAPGSPYGFGGTHGSEGRPNFPDFAGSGAGMSNPALIARIRAGDCSKQPPMVTSPAWVLQHYVLRNRIELDEDHPLLDGMFALRPGDDGFPGDVQESPNWPGYAPGDRGIVNSISPKHLAGLAEAVVQAPDVVPLLWLRGSEDGIVSDRSGSDPAVLGAAGLIPGFPGENAVPPQPMLAQTRYVLDARAAASGGAPYQERVLDGLGHCPYLEDPRWVYAEISRWFDDIRA
ncbi:Pimeloyl-ACP methyl ester carboxylesterase [Cyclonatronum proteinivorum]|uniref:Pimeloyl-ACP methyl ester carboxylesterase n=1 Tax=Cyclonatronum proteinivorum TaxID=1457365 RepID=A0A345UHS3_9BACT|nr:alpha/beta fold hydrolase [Cyclonatronum proteinivorum]AXJ00025.1 Pimeloyl-ACP methyl ester carboxylesterase [Cyclonatronum proteinivorum]